MLRLLFAVGDYCHELHHRSERKNESTLRGELIPIYEFKPKAIDSLFKLFLSQSKVVNCPTVLREMFVCQLTLMMRCCFVPLSTVKIFHISIGAWVLPGNRSQSGLHREKKDIFLFIILHYPCRVGNIRISSVGTTVDRRGDDEIWDTWLDLKRRHSTANRRRHGARIMLH
ncbi:hypothetical protein WA026_007354 [Henosepilachna vigintioctopunctata]|uniref:Uncharacterized protein n=1 Tax=Henosepilachna vigintioctopunctata TaxID=420089 RepID=A0AAW1UNY4_9CUCU